MYEAMRALGITLVIRGQRGDERLKGSAFSGMVEKGVEYLFPLEDWTEEMVCKFLLDEGVQLPRNYGYFNSSMDCTHCTAYLAENDGKLDYLTQHYPEASVEVTKRLVYIRDAVSHEMTHLNRALETYA